MNSGWLKILACVFMLADHMGLVLWPDYVMFRIFGRLSFPLFAFCLAEGYKHTHDLNMYMGRLLFFGLISQLPYSLTFEPVWPELNIFFELAAGLFALALYDRYKNIIPFIVIGAAAELAHADYGLGGLLMIYGFYKFYADYRRMALWIFWGSALICFKQIIWVFWGEWTSYVSVEDLNRQFLFVFIQLLAVFSVFFICFYNGQKGASGLKYVFYFFYPLHLAVLYAAKLIMEYCR